MNDLDKENNVKIVGYARYILALIISFCAYDVIYAVGYSKPIPLISLYVMLIGLVILIGIDYYYKRKLSKTQKKEEKLINKLYLKKGTHIEQDIMPFVFLSGIISQYFAFYNIIYKIVFIIIYIFITVYLFYNQRTSIKTFSFSTFFHFGICIVIPMLSYSWNNPEIFSQIGYIDVFQSRRFSFLTFMYLEVGLVYTTIISSTYSWRTQYLIRNGYSENSIKIKHRDFISKFSNEKKRDKLREILSDEIIMRNSVLSGSFESAIVIGWSIIERLLISLSTKKSVRARADEINVLNSNFDNQYDLRNKMVHGNYKPNFQDSINIMRLIDKMIFDLTIK